MADFLSAYSVQNWLESCPQGYLVGTAYGHGAEEIEPPLLLDNPVLLEDAIRTTVQLIVGERCALAASSGLINSAPDEASKRFLATQTLDEMYALSQEMNPKFAHTLSGTIADERRHVGFGENRIGSLIKQHPEKKPAIEKMQREMSYFMLATFADAFGTSRTPAELERLGQPMARADYQGVDLGHASVEEMERVLADTVLKEFKVRLGRIGVDYQTPIAA